jgi:mannose-6-phosphate isomerase-like protein (cupin superfamily)
MTLDVLPGIGGLLIMIDHLELKTNRIKECTEFYAAVLAPLGYSRRTGDGNAAGFGDGAGMDLFLLPGEPTTPHFAFRAPTRQLVKVCCEIGSQLGALARLPALAPSVHPHYYAGYLHDPDGRSLEFVCHEPEVDHVGPSDLNQPQQPRPPAAEAGVRSASSVAPRPWGKNCQAWELLARTDIAVVHEQMPNGTAEHEHFHEKARQFFFVLKGTLSIRLFGRDYLVRCHEGLEVPPGARHWVRNESGDTTEFLAIAHPSTAGDRIDLMSDNG